MTRSVKDLRELICVSRLSIRDSDEDEDYDLSRPLSSLSIYGERSTVLVNGNGDNQQRGQVSTESGFAVPRPPSSAKGGSRLKSGEKPRSPHSRSLSDHSSLNLRKGSAPLPPVGGGSRPGSNSSSGSDRPGSGETARNNFDHVLQYLTDVAVTEWLERTTQMLNELTVWCNNLDNFIDFAQFWLTEFPENQRLEIYKLELGIVADELIAAFGDSFLQRKVKPSDISGIVSAVFKEYPNKLCSAQGVHVFLDILDTITSQKTQGYRRLLTDTRISTRNNTYAQSLLALRAFTIVSLWSSVVQFYKRLTQPAVGAEGGNVQPDKKSMGNDGEHIAQQRLFRAIQKGYVSVIYYFLRNGRVKLDVRDDHGRTLTFAAVLANQSSVLHYLITKHKAALPVNEAGESGNTPLHTAANWNYVDCIQVLITKGNADVNIPNQECDNATPLHVAVMQGHLEATKMLVSAGANVNASMSGITPLQLATDMGHDEIRELLLTKSGLGDYHDEAMDVTDGIDDS